MEEIRLIIAGGRDFSDRNLMDIEVSKFISELVSEFPECNVRIVSGHARGADQCGEDYGRDHGHTVCVFPANWKLYGKRAGYLRNCEMAEFASEPNSIGALIAFWDGKSRGTKHMIDIAESTGLRTVVVPYTKEGD